MDNINRKTVQSLYDYRSRLIHRTRDKHNLNFDVDAKLENCRVTVITSEIATKKLIKLIFDENDTEKPSLYSLNYTISVIIHRCLDDMELVLDSLYEMILANSGWPHSAYTEESDIFMINLNPDTNMAEPASKKMWQQFKT